MLWPANLIRNPFIATILMGLSLLLIACSEETDIPVDPDPSTGEPGPSTGEPGPSTGEPGPSTNCFTDGALSISNISVPQTLATQPYNVKTLQIGQELFVDRTYTFTVVPSELLGTNYIVTANDDKSITGATFLSFAVNKAVEVYIALDTRISQPPGWMSDWTNYGKSVADSVGTRNLYYKSFSDCSVTLGGNGGNADTSMYSVFIVEPGVTAPPASPAPSAINDSITTIEDTAISIPVLDNDTNIANAADISLSIATAANNGTTTIEINNTITYAPNVSYSGTDSFVYKITDTQNRSDTATVTINVSCLQCANTRFISLNWIAAPAEQSVSGYRVYLGSNATSVNSLVDVIAVNRLNFDPLNPAVTYNAGSDLNIKTGDIACMKITAYNSVGESDPSPIVCSNPL